MHKNIIVNFDKIWFNMFRTGRNVILRLKTLSFNLKIEIRKKCINSSVKGTHKNIIVNFYEIWFNMLRTERDINIGCENTVFHLKY